MTASERAGQGVPRWEVSTRGPLLVDDAPACARVHRAVRHLAAACTQLRRPLPIVPVVTLDGTGAVEAHLAAPFGAPPQPWEAVGYRWRLREEVPEVAVPEAWPALVEIGHAAGRRVLVDLAAAPGPVGLDGGGRAVRAFVRRLADQLTAAPWARDVEVRVVGVGDVTGPRVASIASPLDVLPTPVPDLGGVHGRWGAPPRGSHQVVLCSRELTDAELRAVREAGRRRDAPTVVAVGSGRGAWRWRLGAGSLTW